MVRLEQDGLRPEDRLPHLLGHDTEVGGDRHFGPVREGDSVAQRFRRVVKGVETVHMEVADIGVVRDLEDRKIPV